MKSLTLVRHAKSSWSAPGLADFDRPLNERGKRDLPVSARRFAATCPVPDRILTSPAARALTTARGFAEALGMGGDAMVEDRRIYEASRGNLFSVLREQPETLDDVMLVGHSPGIADLAHALCGAPGGKFPTCAILRLRIADRRWADLGDGDGELLVFDTPKRPALDGD
jgi:phosphohistidine phosphatase